MAGRWRTRLRDLDFPEAGRLIIDPEDFGGPSSWGDVFGRQAPLGVEIGFGKGEFLLEMARRHPEYDVVGFELDTARLRWVEHKVFQAGLPNVRLVGGDAMLALPRVFRGGQVAAAWMNFPDPWPKKRHEGRRLIRPAVLDELIRILAPGGRLVVVTDVEHYARHGLAILESRPGHVANEQGAGVLAPELDGYPQTVHEWKFRRAGRSIHFLDFRRV